MRRWWSESWERARVEVLAFFGALVMKLLFVSLRRRIMTPQTRRVLQDNDAKILAFWHARQLLMAPYYLEARGWCYPAENLSVLISAHRDGRLIARIIQYFGIRSVAGSSTRGGPAAQRELLNRLEQGMVAVVTPDGPRGPACRVKPGVIHLARKSGRPIFPLSYSAERKWQFGSWDSMILPKPFSRAVMLVGDPLYVPRDATEEQEKECAAELERRLNSITETADNYEYD